jgi:hypothetical protein
MTGTRFIRAVLVTDGRSPRLPAVFAALAALERKPDALHVVILADADLPDIPSSLGADVLRSAVPTYSRAIDMLLAEFPASASEHDDEILWLLHDDTAPAPGALARLDAVARKRPRAAVVGATHVRWDDASRLVNVGTTVPRWGGKRIGLAAEDDVDQGQHASRDDVLAVSLAAALVSRSVWEKLGGLDGTYAGFGDSADFCRRVWVAGHDVVIVPGAKVRHSQESLYARRDGIGSKRATHAARRAGEWTHAFVWAPVWLVPLLALALPVNALARAVMRIMQNYPGLVLAELRAPWLVLARTGSMAASRARISAIATRRGVERGLLAGPGQVWRHIRERELGGREAARMERAPTDVVRGELAVRKARNRVWFAVTSVVALAASLALSVRWIVDVAGGAMITGVGVGATDVSAADLWARGWTGWSESGLGIPALDGAFATMLSPLALVGGDLRVGFGLVLALAPLVAVVGAWSAAGAATRSAHVRAAVALAYGLWPLFLASVADARLGAVIAHVALPWVAWGLAFATGWRKGEILGDGSEYPAVHRPSASAGLLAAVALAAATVAAPVLLLPSVAVLAALGAGARAMRWRVWTIGLLPVVIGLPGLVAAARHLGEAASILAREPGPSAPFTPLSPWGLLTGADGSWRWPGAFESFGAASYVPGALALTAALCALVLAWRSRAVIASVAVAGIGFLTAVGSQASVAAWPDGAGNPGVVGWPGAGSSLAAAGLLGAAAIAYGRIPGERGPRARLGAGFARVGAGIAVLAFAAGAAALAWPGAIKGVGESASSEVLPLAIPLEQEGAERIRALVLATSEDGSIEYSVLASDGSEYVSGRPFASSSGDPLARPASAYAQVDVLAETVAELAAGGESDTSQLAAWGIGLVVVAAGEDRIQAALDSNTAVSLVGGSERGTTYRIDRPLSDISVARAWIEGTDGVTVVPSTFAGGRLELPEGAGGLFVIAVPADPAWSASLDGEALYETRDDLGRQAFALPSGGGVLEYSYRDGAHRAWWWAAAAATAWALLGAIPLGARSLKEHES